jgi:squalene-hopene/tetraprenyl-beta-curcumene cyclase
MPTFCRGWGKLAFDRSGADLTAHALSAWQAWLPHLQEPLRSETARAIARAKSFLASVQNQDGSWSPLWFGNEHAPDEENRTYGTARVAIALARSGHPILQAGLRWLQNSQNSDGGWGGAPGAPSSIEETALATHALAQAFDGLRDSAVERGAAWLIEATEQGTRTDPAPIGLYFARLWYFEELYPLIFSVGALAHVRQLTSR